MSTLIVERSFPEPITDEALKGVMQRLAPCLAEYNVDYKGSFLSADRQRMICRFEAAEAPFDRVWVADILGA